MSYLSINGLLNHFGVTYNIVLIKNYNHKIILYTRSNEIFIHGFGKCHQIDMQYENKILVKWPP